METTYLAVDKYFDKYCSKDPIVVNIASILGLSTAPCIEIYITSKFGVVGFSKSLSEKPALKKKNIKIITICPGFTATKLCLDSPINKIKPIDHDVFLELINTVKMQE